MVERTPNALHTHAAWLGEQRKTPRWPGRHPPRSTRALRPTSNSGPGTDLCCRDGLQSAALAVILGLFPSRNVGYTAPANDHLTVALEALDRTVGARAPAAMGISYLDCGNVYEEQQPGQSRRDHRGREAHEPEMRSLE